MIDPEKCEECREMRQSVYEYASGRPRIGPENALVQFRCGLLTAKEEATDIRGMRSIIATKCVRRLVTRRRSGRNARLGSADKARKGLVNSLRLARSRLSLSPISGEWPGSRGAHAGGNLCGLFVVGHWLISSSGKRPSAAIGGWETAHPAGESRLIG